MPNLLLRLITGAVIAAVTLIATYCGGLVFRLFCLCAGAVILYEWNGITAQIRAARGRVCAWLFYLLLGGALLTVSSFLWSFAVLAAGAFFTYGFARAEKDSTAAAFQTAGFIYAALFPLSFALLREGLALGGNNDSGIGLYWTLFLYIIVWFSDIGAYICGRLCGGPKLAPKISPGKTWSGAVGGVIFAVPGALGFVFLAQQESILLHGAAVMADFIPFFSIIAVSVFLAVVAQIGDLAESQFKRRFGVKDSGRLLPGHGGIMDRIDGLLPACLVFICLLAVAGWGFP